MKKIFEKQIKTPYERVPEHPDIFDEDKMRPKKIKETLDIVTLQENLEKACEELYYIASKNCAVFSKRQCNG